MCVECFLLVFLEAFINIAAQALVLLIFVRVIMSWVPMRLPFGLNELVWNVTEPVLAPIRRFMPMAGVPPRTRSAASGTARSSSA